jgi:hypothetical protein
MRFLKRSFSSGRLESNADSSFVRSVEMGPLARAELGAGTMSEIAAKRTNDGHLLALLGEQGSARALLLHGGLVGALQS